ncbi:MAG: hypothetical protein AAF267_06760 [Deinococcota bacterium]
MTTGLVENSLAKAVQDHPYQDFHDWWPIGKELTAFMTKAILKTHNALPHTPAHSAARTYFQEYIQTVFAKDARMDAFDRLLSDGSVELESGEFDAFSYAFYRSAFEHIAAHPAAFDVSVERARRLFTKDVGKLFFAQVDAFVGLELPQRLETPADLNSLKAGIAKVGEFLATQGYLRDHFGFRFDVDLSYNNQHVQQADADTLSNIQAGKAYALYEMGYPVILPSAVYLYQTMGEAQHHSSRTIEDLFERVGLEAREVDDFDPRDYPSDMVVELWEIKPL